jgi:uncharacterized protein involved in exopolysaccharide biosynthesis
LAVTQEVWMDDEASLDLRALLGRLWRQRWWLMAGMLLGTILAVTYVRIATPIYRATTTVISTSDERNSLSGSLMSALGDVSGGLASLTGLGLGSPDAGTQEAIAVLQSRQFTESFIRDLKVMPRLFPRNWDAKAGKWLAPPEEQPTLGKAFNYFNNRVRAVLPDKKTGLVAIQVEWRDPAEAALWANALVSRVNAEMRARAIKQSEASLEFLESELQRTTVLETRQAIHRMIEGQIKQRMLANVSHGYAFRVVDPAFAPDPDDPVKPKKLLILAAGPIAGLLLAIMTLLTLDWLRGRPVVTPGA